MQLIHSIPQFLNTPKPLLSPDIGKRITPQQVAIRVQAKAAESGDENYPSYRTVYRVLQPIIEEHEQKASVRNRGWRGSRLSLKTRDGLDLSVEYSNHIWQCDSVSAP